MTTKEAIQAMLDGNKVRPVDEKVAYFEHCYFDGVGFIDHNKDYFDFNYWMKNHTDWEIYEEPKKQTVTIEKWLFKDKFGIKVVQEIEKDCVLCYCNEFNTQKIKILDTYEVEL